MLTSLLSWVAAIYGLGALYGWLTGRLEQSAYPSPEDAEREMEALAERHPERCLREIIGESTEGRPLAAYRLRGVVGDPHAERPRLLITAHIHAVEYIGSFVARAVARRLVSQYGYDDVVTALLDRADVWVVPLLNPDGARRIWQRHGWALMGGARATANGVDPNRNFPFHALGGRTAWNSASPRPGSAYYRGPRPLSEPECAALARLCARERYCAAINFHSFGGVVFMPRVEGAGSEKARGVLGVFQSEFQRHQRHYRYRPVAEPAARILGQLDPFLLDAFGTPSVTVEVSRLGRHVALPWNTFSIFWWANPAQPERWVRNDVMATIHALGALVDASGATPCTPAHPELAAGLTGPPPRRRAVGVAESGGAVHSPSAPATGSV